MIGASDRFFKQLNAGVIPLDFAGRISWSKKRRTDTNWFSLGVSSLNGSDLLATMDNNPSQVWDAYDFADLGDRLLKLKVSRSVEFPYAVQSSVADFELNNYDKKFDFKNGLQILPRRPVRFVAGVSAEKVPVFVGMTQGLPKYNETTASWTALDFLSEIAESELPKSLKLQNARTDEVIGAILRQFGMESAQFNLKKGQNTIPFVKFDKGENAGGILKKLVQAENGSLWLDELGIVRFETRSGSVGKTPVQIFNDSNTVSLSLSRESGITNHVKIKSEVRAVQPRQIVFSQENSVSEDNEHWRVKANNRLEVWLKLDDPVINLEPMILNGEARSMFEAMSGKRKVMTGLTVTGELLNDSYKVVFKNANNTAVDITKIELWGEPAKVIDTINYEAKVNESIAIFGDQVLNIEDNNFFGSYRNCDLFAMDILRKRSSYSAAVELVAKINPALQLGDIVSLSLPEKQGDYMIRSLELDLAQGTMKLKLWEHNTMAPFILDKSVLDGKEVLS